MRIVPVNEIPKTVIDTPTDDLLKLYDVCEEMKQICIADDGIGLAAVQVGIPWKLFVVDHGLEGWEYFVNCKYTPLDRKVYTFVEGCLSLKNERGEPAFYTVGRFHRVFVEGFKLVGWPPTLAKIGFGTQTGDVYNVVYQHEIDHQNGILISDKGVITATCQ